METMIFQENTTICLLGCSASDHHMDQNIAYPDYKQRQQM